VGRKTQDLAGVWDFVNEMLAIVIEAGVGLAGFAGIAVVLSGDPRNWSSAERLRIGTMLFLTLFVVFGSFLCLFLTRHFDETVASRLVSGLMSVTFFIANAIIWKKSRDPIQSGDPTINRGLAYVLWFFFLLVALLLAVNAAGWFGDSFAAFFAALIWLLLFGAFLFVRILFVRPGLVARGD